MMRFCFCKSNNIHSLTVCCLFLIVLLAHFPTVSASAEFQLSYQGQMNLRLTLPLVESRPGEKGARYLPGIRSHMALEDGMEFDGEAIINFYLTSSETSEDFWQESIHAHRLWGRIFSNDSSIRLGLQKINWGPGKTLRALQWFDRIDPRDHSGFTEGVNALLVRSYFDNNANLWGWILYGNQQAMGISPHVSAKNQPEFGGRIQIPVENGEAGVSFHHRRINAGHLVENLRKEEKMENRIGLDAQWDLGPGLWFEFTYVEIAKAEPLSQRKRLSALGIDYTLDFGNGLYTALEAMQIQSGSSSATTESSTQWTAALTQNYPLDLLHHVGLIALWDIEQKTGKLHANWRRVQDDIIWNVAFYYNETIVELPTGDSGASNSRIARDRGLQLVVQYNH